MSPREPSKPRGGETSSIYGRPLRVAVYTATRPGDADRGPEVRMNSGEASFRLLTEGELVYVQGPRRRELAVLHVDESLGRGDVAVRDIAGIAPSEIVTVHKPDFDRRPPRGFLA